MTQERLLDYRLLVDNFTTAIVLVDDQLNIIYMNSSSEALFDMSSLLCEWQQCVAEWSWVTSSIC